MATRIPFRETAEWALGRRGEDAVADLCRAFGWYVTRTADYSGPDGNWAPRMHGKYDALTLPDIDVARFGRSCYIEVKTKTRSVEHRQTGRLVHGFERRLWDDYRRTGEVSGRPVWLWVCEARSRQVCAAWVPDLAPDSEYDGPAFDEPMVFFARRRFALKGHWNPETGVAVAQLGFDGEPADWDPEGGER